MLLPASEEFVALCRSQLALVVKGLGASSLAVYLTEGAEDDPTAQTWMPVATYPESDRAWRSPPLLPPPISDFKPPQSELLPPPNNLVPSQTFSASDPPLSLIPKDNYSPGAAVIPPLGPDQLALPLIYQNWVLGLLLAGREGQPWIPWEQDQLEQVAHTLAIACILDQRQQWLSRPEAYELHRDSQHTVLDNLLHQLRNPLTAVRTFAKLLRKRLSHPNHALAEGIWQESERMEELLSQFSQVLEQPPLPPHSHYPLRLAPAPQTCTSLAEILAPLIQSAQARAEAQNIHLVLTDLTPLPDLHLNGDVLREVLNNLLDNAFKYTPSGGSVGIELVVVDSPSLPDCEAQETAHYDLRIWDTGPGIPAADQAHLFERGYRGIQANGEIPGTGLGLAIAQDLLQPLGIHIQVESPYPAHGTTGTAFRLRLPALINTPFLSNTVDSPLSCHNQPDGSNQDS
ncbi:GAF domain-containing sensor histidine kinase [Candidatus Synechococcus calcipolaris G9]|uniref:histidine kinase n=1 Tax=Candidatus Synechococcus calcipolaris G9 TaxID=1497997 RepID=A0ABT6EXC0_9SYNE|nr:GAF domain-containing sensor histidine kinase [Candidatus Synechococcus calcipolaris]MDG2990139.1 GAF domain-containing sensor histidine kinase [Candidatus Synechococcus calcipolaris G9]